jgi:hypothetical protein
MVNLNGMAFLLNFIKNLTGPEVIRGDTQMCRQTENNSGLVSLAFLRGVG